MEEDLDENATEKPLEEPLSPKTPSAKASGKKVIVKKRASAKTKASAASQSSENQADPKSPAKAKGRAKALRKMATTNPTSESTGGEQLARRKTLDVKLARGKTTNVEDKLGRSKTAPDVGEMQEGAENVLDEEPEPYGPKYLDLLKQKFPFQNYIEDTAHRGVSLRQLRRVREFTSKHVNRWKDIGAYSKTKGDQLSLPTINLYQLNDWFIKPATFNNQCAYVELVARGSKQTPTWFVSHWWGEPVAEFIMCVEKHVAVRVTDPRRSDFDPIDTTYWVCAYANRQHNLQQDLNDDPRKTSFYRAMQLTKGVLLILDTIGPATPFKRVWCAFEEAELMLAEGDRGEGLENGQGMGVLLDIVTVVGKDYKRAELITDGITSTDDDGNHHVGGPEQVKAQREQNFPIKIIKAGLALELEKSQASNDDDRIHILNCLAGRDVHAMPVLETHENYTKINQRLRAIFAVAAWRQAIESKGGSISKDLGLSEVVRSDVWRESLNLNFAFCKISDADIKDVAQGLPTSLKKLTLDLRRCQRLSDIGLRQLAKKLPPSLQSLNLIFTGCRKISTPFFVALANHMPESLEVLELNFYACAGVTNPAVAALAQALPKLSLTQVYLNFSWCEQLTNPSALLLFRYLPTDLQSLEILFRKTGITDDIADVVHELNFSDAEEERSDVDPAKILELAGDAPGKYIVIRDKVPTTPSLGGHSPRVMVAEASFGVVLDILEVKCDTRDACKIWGRIQESKSTPQFKTWVLLLDVGSLLKAKKENSPETTEGRWATMETPKGGDGLGKYVVLRDKTPVGLEAERVGDGAGKLDKGKVVRITVVKDIMKLKKVRGQVEKPHGWITLSSMDAGPRLVAFVPAIPAKLQEIVTSMKPTRKPLDTGISNLMEKLKKKIPSFDEVEKELEAKRKEEVESVAVSAIKDAIETKKRQSMAMEMGKTPSTKAIASSLKLKLKGVVEELHERHAHEEEVMHDTFEDHGKRRSTVNFAHTAMSRTHGSILHASNEAKETSNRSSGRRLTVQDVVGHLKAIQEADEETKQEAFLEAVDGGVDDVIEDAEDQADISVKSQAAPKRQSVHDVMVHLKVLQDVDDNVLHEALDTVLEDEEDSDSSDSDVVITSSPLMQKAISVKSISSRSERSTSPRPLGLDDKNAVREYFQKADLEGTGLMHMPLCKDLLRNIFPDWPEAEMDDLLAEAPGGNESGGQVRYGEFIDWLYGDD